MSKFTEEEIRFLEENVDLEKDDEGLNIIIVKTTIHERVLGNVGDVVGHVVGSVVGCVGECVGGNVGSVLGRVVEYVRGSVGGKINGKNWRYVDENRD